MLHRKKLLEGSVGRGHRDRKLAILSCHYMETIGWMVIKFHREIGQIQSMTLAISKVKITLTLFQNPCPLIIFGWGSLHYVRASGMGGS